MYPARPSIGAREAFTLPELLVAMTIGLLTLGIVVSLVVTTLRVSFRGTARIQLQQSAMMLVDSLSSDLAQAPMAGLELFSSGDTFWLTIHPLANVGLDVEQQWSSSLVVYAWDKKDGRVLRLVVPSGSTEHPVRPTAAQVQGWLKDERIPRRLVATEVTSFELKSALPAPKMGQPLTLVLELERPATGSQGAEKFALHRDFFLMNSAF